MLARVDTICFDKTGTITDGRMTVSEVISVSDSDVNVDDIMSSMLNVLSDNNQTAIALHTKFGDNKIYEHTSLLPFNSLRKLSAVTFKERKSMTSGTYCLS